MAVISTARYCRLPRGTYFAPRTIRRYGAVLAWAVLGQGLDTRSPSQPIGEPLNDGGELRWSTNVGDVTLSLEDDDRVNARKDLSQRVKTHAEVRRTPSTTEEEGWHVEIAVAVNSHPEEFERYIVGDLAGRESLVGAMGPAHPPR
jgi:hypothetical protein